MSDLVERLRTVKLLSQRNQMALQAEAADTIEQLQADKRELMEALAPFADACTITNKDDDEVIDDSIAATRITFGHLRAALAKITSQHAK